MTDIVSQVRERVSSECLVTRCQKEGCSLRLNNAPTPYILIDMDHPQTPVSQNERRCDYIFIGGGNDSWLAPMELKRGKPSASEIVPQLRASAIIADRIIPPGEQVRFRPIAVFGGDLNRIERERLLRDDNLIRFRDQRIPVRLLRCGRPLADALRS